MNELTTWTEIFFDSLRSFGQKFMGALPSLFGAILIFFLGWLFAKIFSAAIARVLKVVKFDTLADRANAAEYLSKANITMAPSKLVGKFVYWILLLLVLITAADTLGWDAVSSEISRLIGYLPKLLVAIVIFIIGTYIASFVRDVIAGATRSLGISTGKMISSFVFYLLFIVVTLTALKQAGIDTSIISNNLLLILGAILASASISYGIASKDVLANILAGYFGRNTYLHGMEIEVDGIRGIIKEKSSVGLVLETKDLDRIILPTSKLINNPVRVIGGANMKDEPDGDDAKTKYSSF